MKIRVVGTYKVPGCADDKIGSVIDTSDKLEAIKMFIEKLQDTEENYDLVSVEVDTEVKYI